MSAFNKKHIFLENYWRFQVPTIFSSFEHETYHFIGRIMKAIHFHVCVKI